MSGGESANDTGGVKEMEATHDTRTTEKGHDLDVAPGRSNAELARLLPHPAADANKYTRGHLSLVAGSAAYPGAACLAAAAGERTGAGYTEVFCAGKSMITVRGWRPSLVVRDWRAWKPAKAPAPRPGHPTACVIGCGFDAAETSLTSLLMETVRSWEAPLLIDGGALALLANATGLRLARGPQPGARRYSRPTAARRRGWLKGPGRPWKRPRSQRPAERAAPLRRLRPPSPPQVAPR